MPNVATGATARNTFRSDRYLAGLLREMDSAQISLRIREARKAAVFRSREQLADVLLVHRNTIENWEDPKNSNVPYDRMDELAAVLNVDKRWLLHGEEAQRHSAGDDKRIGEILLRLESLEEQVGRLAKAEDLTRGLDLLRAAIDARASRDTGQSAATDGP